MFRQTKQFLLASACGLIALCIAIFLWISVYMSERSGDAISEIGMIYMSEMSRQLQEKFNLAYIFIAHGLPSVRHISSKIAVMYLGKLVEAADYKTLFANPLHPYTKALLASIPRAKPGTSVQGNILTGDVPSPVNPPAGCRFSGRCAYAKPVCTEEEPKLRQVGESQVACHLVS